MRIRDPAVYPGSATLVSYGVPVSYTLPGSRDKESLGKAGAQT
jgi:hypothetical protein